jgi:quercetin dioxygenase-like cupin family protein
MSESQVVVLGDVSSFDVAEGIRMRALFGDGAMLNQVELDPGAAVSLHSHPHEQLGYVISGEIVMTIDGEDHRLGPGAAYVIPGGVEHGGAAGENGCHVLDVFLPIREDYRALAEPGA